MKVVILAGGKGTRISEESVLKPKPMVEIGDKPILWHIMKLYSYYGHNDFIVCCGYKGQMIKQYFLNYYMYQTDVCFHLHQLEADYYDKTVEPWKIIMANTGLNTLTAGRILKIREYIGEDEEFMLTYGDGVANIDLKELLEFHRSHGKIVTISATQPGSRFGVIKYDSQSGEIEHFKEKARKDQSWVNAGFMVMNCRVFEYLGDGSTMLEDMPFERLATDRQMVAYRHNGFWSPMDNIHDRAYLQELWDTGHAPWKIWND